MIHEPGGKWNVNVIFVLIICAGEVFGGGNVSEKNNLVIKDYDLDKEYNSYEDVGNYNRPMVAKCCELNYGYSFQNKSTCVETKGQFLVEFEDKPEDTLAAKNMSLYSRYEYFLGDPCKDEKYILDYQQDNFTIYSNGTLLYFDFLYGTGDFCLENVNEDLRVFMCFGVHKIKDEFEYDFTVTLYAIALLISIPFLVATAVVYLCFDMFRDLRGKSLACHVLSLAIGYLFLAIIQLGSDQLNEEMCIAAGFIIQFFFVAAFFWLNVICYDTWRCINKDFRCAYKPLIRRSEKIKFWYYSLYGWYMPSLLTIVSLVMDLTPAIPDSYLKPNFGFRSCWFYPNDSALPYFYGPVGIIILINIVFFVLSAIKIYSEQKKRINRMLEDSRHEDETREKSLSIRIYTKTLQECIYLFGIMGINWAAEVISWAVGGSKIIWLVTDLFNAFQGIFIFYLFVVKPIKVRDEVKCKLHKNWKKIIKCDCRREEQNKRISRHWHANIHKEFEESELHMEALQLQKPTDV